MADMEIEVAYGTAEKQRLYRFRLPPNATARQAALAAPILRDFPEADPATAPLGIFGKAVDAITPCKKATVWKFTARFLPTPKKHGAGGPQKPP